MSWPTREAIVTQIVETDEAADAVAIADAILALFEPARDEWATWAFDRGKDMARLRADLDALLPLARAVVMWRDQPDTGCPWSLRQKVDALPPDLAARLREGA